MVRLMWSWRFWTVMGILALVTAVTSAFQGNWVLAVGLGMFTASAATNTSRIRRLEQQMPPPDR